MTLNAVALVAADGEVIDANRADAAIHHVLRGLFGDMNKLRIKILVPPFAFRILRLEQDALAFAELVFIQLGRLHRIVVFDFDHTARTDHGVERDSVERRAVFDEMVQTVHVGPGVAAQIHFGNVADGALVHVGEAFDVDRRVGGPVHHAGV